MASALLWGDVGLLSGGGDGEHEPHGEDCEGDGEDPGHEGQGGGRGHCLQLGVDAHVGGQEGHGGLDRGSWGAAPRLRPSLQVRLRQRRTRP